MHTDTTTPENGDGLATPHSQPAEKHLQNTTKSIALINILAMKVLRYLPRFEWVLTTDTVLLALILAALIWELV